MGAPSVVGGFSIDIGNNTNTSQSQQCAHEYERFMKLETRVYECLTEIIGRFVTIYFPPGLDRHLRLCEVQVFGYTEDTDCSWTGLACIEGKTQKLTNPAGEIESPSIYNNGIYMSNVTCVWEIEVAENQVSICLKMCFTCCCCFLRRPKPLNTMT